jgi:alcohol dehydrogenase class IV
MHFEFATASRIKFGAGTFKESGRLAKEFGRRALVACGLGCERAAPLLDLLAEAGVEAVLFSVEGEPDVSAIERGTRVALQADCDLVIGFGGGSAIDSAKAVGVLATNLAGGGEIYDYLEVIGAGRALEKPSLPCIAIPTTAGTGAEVTRNAVIGAPDQQLKVSLRSPSMLPRLALVDPELTYSLPPEITAATGLDALTQLIEPFVSRAANPLTDALCREGMRRAARSLRRAYHAGSDPESREGMALASLFGGLALANAKLGAVHGFAGPVGGAAPAPHGAVCARLLPLVMEVNLRALKARQPDDPVILRYEEIAQTLTGNEGAEAEEGPAWVRELAAELGISPLSTYGLESGDIPQLVEKSARASSMQGNPIQLTAGEMEEIMERAL